jgi:SAF domain-containing protein
MKRWLIAAAALLAGGGVSAALLVAADPSRSAVDVFAAAHDLPAGAALSTDAIQLRRVSVAGGTGSLFTRGDESRLVAMRAAHDLAAGQLIQRGDVMGSASFADRRLVFIPLSGVPPAPAGAKVDLLLIGGSADHPTVVPFALGVEVQASVSGGLIVAVPAKEAAAFVYAAAGMHLAAVVAEPGAADGTEVPISSIEDAISVVAGR